MAGAWPDQLKLKKLDDELLGDEDDYDDEDYYDEDYDEDEDDDELYDDEEYYEDDYKEDEKVGVMKLSMFGMFNRPVVAGAVLQTPPSFIKSVRDPFPPNL